LRLVLLYYYAWRSGPKLRGEPGSPEFINSYNDAIASQKRPVSGTLLTDHGISKLGRILEEVRRDAARVKAYLRLIEDKFGDMPIEALSDPRVRGEFKAWRDKMADKPRKADYAPSTLAQLLSFAKDRGRISVNPCKRGGRLYEADRTEQIWSEDDIAKVLGVTGKP
jgi:hypothetical protein